MKLLVVLLMLVSQCEAQHFFIDSIKTEIDRGKLFYIECESYREQLSYVGKMDDGIDSIQLKCLLLMGHDASILRRYYLRNNNEVDAEDMYSLLLLIQKRKFRLTPKYYFL